MYFEEVFSLANKKVCVREFLVFASRDNEVLDINRLTIALTQMIECLKTLKPVYSDNHTIHIGQDEDENGTYDFAYMTNEGDVSKDSCYSFEIVSWAEILGYRVVENNLENYTKEYYVMLVLWEMTFFGYDEETIHNRAKKLLEIDEE